MTSSLPEPGNGNTGFRDAGFEDMSFCSWQSLGVEHTQWLDEMEGKTFCRDFYLACKSPTQPLLFTVEFNGNKSKKVDVSLFDYVDILLLNKEVKSQLLNALAKSTCLHTKALRDALAQQYMQDATNNLGELYE